MAAISLPKSPVSLSLDDEAPHIFTRKLRLRPAEVLIIDAKRLLQHNRPTTDIAGISCCSCEAGCEALALKNALRALGSPDVAQIPDRADWMQRA